MKFYQGNKTSIPFDVKEDKAIAQFVRGLFETSNEVTIRKLIALGYEHDGEFREESKEEPREEPKRRGRPKKED